MNLCVKTLEKDKMTKKEKKKKILQLIFQNKSFKWSTATHVHSLAQVNISFWVAWEISDTKFVNFDLNTSFGRKESFNIFYLHIRYLRILYLQSLFAYSSLA